MTSVGALGSAKYLSLTTFRRDGTPVATPVWLVEDGDRLRVITSGDSGKVKRIRHTPGVLLAPCDARGRLKGVQVPGTAVLQSAEETIETERLIARRYGLLGRLILYRSRRRAKRGGAPGAGLSITVGRVPSGEPH